jgi:cation/acetate symporter
MVSTTWVQFLKGSLLVVFSFVLTVMILFRGFSVKDGGEDGHKFGLAGPFSAESADFELLAHYNIAEPDFDGWSLVPSDGSWKGKPFLRMRNDRSGAVSVWSVTNIDDGKVMLREAQILTKTADGNTLVNGQKLRNVTGDAELHPTGHISKLPGDKRETGPVGPLEFFSTLQNSTVVLWGSEKIIEPDGTVHTVYFQKPTDGSRVLRPGEHPTFKGIRSDDPLDKLNFFSLMLALFCGTASLPHILIRYYTVKDEASARKSTIVGIAAIGFFYVLTLYMGLGAMTSGALDVTNSNMSAPLLAKSMSEFLFAVISAIAFTTVLGTVSGLILASAGAVTHDLLTSVAGVQLNDHDKVRVAKIASVVVGAVAIVLGILFKELNVSYLVGWAFSVAASANLPALVMLLFWKKTTRQGIIAAVIVGMASSLGWILLSGDTYSAVYGLPAKDAIVPFSQPGIVTIPLGFATLVAVSLLTQPRES